MKSLWEKYGKKLAVALLALLLAVVGGLFFGNGDGQESLSEDGMPPTPTVAQAAQAHQGEAGQDQKQGQNSNDNDSGERPGIGDASQEQGSGEDGSDKQDEDGGSQNQNSADSDSDSSAEEIEDEEIKILYSFRRDEYLQQHFEKHGAEFDYENAQEYLAGANRVIQSPDALHKLEAEDGDDVYYLEESNEFVIVSKDGYIRTYFRPTAGIDYYNRQ